MQKKMKLSYKRPYGNLYLYPEDEDGKSLLRILGVKTLTVSILKKLLAESYKITYIGEKCDILEELGVKKE
jgi:hypothetical protein